MKTFTSAEELHWEAQEQKRRDAIAAKLAGTVVSATDLNPRYLDLLAQFRKEEASDAERACAAIVTLIVMAQIRNGDFPAPEGEAS